ncbi:hypothetical protein [Pseudomonas chlororaphis]|uniref:hypothetical protein n=1 Tax=Pseudomonas chlororaphis TaxID=587753 RepID=UPI0039E2EF8B
MNGNTKIYVSSMALPPLLAIALFLLIADFAIPRVAYGGGWLNGPAFQQTDADIIEEHYKECSKKIPNLTREGAKNLDQQCNPFTRRNVKVQAGEDTNNTLKSKQEN